MEGPWSANTNTRGAMALRVPKPTRIEISYGPIDAVANQPLRLLQKLEGLDTQWKEAGGQMQRAEMQLMVMIHDESYQMLTYRRFTMKGESAGWNGSLEASQFTRRSEFFVLPPGAQHLQVLFTAENWTVLGSAAITGFNVLHQGRDGWEQNIWPDPDLMEGENLNQPQGRPRHWQRGRVGARMAQVLPLPQPAGGHALAIQDDDVHMSATWQAELPLRERAHPGDTLRLEWQEAFSVGIGERSRSTYEPLPPGKYVFRVRTVTPFGEPLGSELSLDILVLQPPWKRPALIFPVGVVSAAAMVGLVWFVVRRRMEAQLRESEHHRWLERERVRIAQDIHDDLGASLTHMNLLSQTLMGKLAADHPAWTDAGHIRGIALSLTEKLDEIVWAVNPRHDTVESLINYLTAFAEEFLGAAGVRTRIHAPMQLPAWSLASGLRHNVFLAAKEVLHNVIKHAQATEVHLRLEPRADGFDLTIQDNGCGFSPSGIPAPALAPRRRHRQGLAGVRARIESLGGRVLIESTPGGGTRVVLSVPLTTIERPFAGGPQNSFVI